MRPSTGSSPSAASVGTSPLARMRPSVSTIPAASFVPPMSIASTAMVGSRLPWPRIAVRTLHKIVRQVNTAQSGVVVRPSAPQDAKKTDWRMDQRLTADGRRAVAETMTEDPMMEHAIRRKTRVYPPRRSKAAPVR